MIKSNITEKKKNRKSYRYILLGFKKLRLDRFADICKISIVLLAKTELYQTIVLFEQENVIFIEGGSPIRAVLFHAAIPQM